VPSTWISAWSLFGFVYAPFFDALGGDITALRVSNALGLVVLAGVLTYQVTGSRLLTLPPPQSQRLGVSLAASTSVLLVFGSALVTPSYNTLNLTGMLVALIGATLVDRQVTWSTVSGSLLVAVGLVLCVFARPTSAVLLALALLGIACIDRRLTVRNLLLQLAVLGCTFTLGVLLTVPGGLQGFVQRYASGSRALTTADPGGYGPLPLLKRFVRDSVLPAFLWTPGVIGLTVLIGFLTVLGMTLLAASSRMPRRVGMVFVVFLGVAGSAALAVPIVLPTLAEQSRSFLVLGPLAATVLATLIHWLRRSSKTQHWRQHLLPAVLAICPFAFAFGSNNPLWLQASYAAVFWVIGLLAALMVQFQALWRPAVHALLATTLLSTGLILAGAVGHPYRQSQQLDKVDTPLQIGPAGGTVLVDTATAAYAQDLRNLATERNLGSDTPLLDLSGESPGASYLMGVHPVGGPWLLGGYPGSDESAKIQLSNVDCVSLSRAWLLVEPQGTKALSEQDILASFGADIHDYRLAADVTDPHGGRQNLMEPVDSEAVAQLCDRIRSRG